MWNVGYKLYMISVIYFALIFQDLWDNSKFYQTYFYLKNKNKGKAIPVQVYYRPRGFQEVEAPRF